MEFGKIINETWLFSATCVIALPSLSGGCNALNFEPGPFYNSAFSVKMRFSNILTLVIDWWPLW